jgi:hypothetical protein
LYIRYDVVVLIAKTYSSWLGLTTWTHPIWLFLSDGKTDVVRDDDGLA